MSAYSGRAFWLSHAGDRAVRVYLASGKRNVGAWVRACYLFAAAARAQRFAERYYAGTIFATMEVR